MRITKSKLRRIIKEELTASGMAKKSTDLEYAPSTQQPTAGPDLAKSVAELLENSGYVLSRGGMSRILELLQSLESDGDMRKHGWD